MEQTFTFTFYVCNNNGCCLFKESVSDVKFYFKSWSVFYSPLYPLALFRRPALCVWSSFRVRRWTTSGYCSFIEFSAAVFFHGTSILPLAARIYFNSDSCFTFHPKRYFQQLFFTFYHPKFSTWNFFLLLCKIEFMDFHWSMFIVASECSKSFHYIHQIAVRNGYNI